MSMPPGSDSSPVTTDDLDHTVQLAVTTLREAPLSAWDANAGSLTWTCWETVEHLSAGFFTYAVTLVHAHNVTQGLGLAWDPPADLCSRALARLFPDAPTHTDAWLTVLWATGRIELPGHPRLTRWDWHPTPLSS